MTFETLPAVHLERGRFPEYPSADPEGALTELARRFGRVVIVDVEGIRRNDPDVEFLQTATKRRAIWADAGSRFATDAMDLFVAGAETVTIRWNTLDSARELEEAAELAQPGAIFLGLEFPRGAFLQNPRDKRSAAEVAALAESLGLGLVLIVDRADDATIHALPTATTPRYLQGAPLAADAQRFGFAGALLAPTEIPQEAPATEAPPS